MPPTGYFYVDPDTGYKTDAGTMTSLVRQVKDHRKGNGLPIADDLEAIIEDFICMNNDPDFSTGATDNAFNVPLTETWIRSSSQTQLLAWKRNKKQFVRQADANVRAEACVHCEFNTRTPVCFSCVGLDTMMDSYFQRSTPADRELRVCKLTAVPNKSQVHLPAEVLIDRKLDMPDHCWYRKEIEKRKQT